MLCKKRGRGAPRVMMDGALELAALKPNRCTAAQLVLLRASQALPRFHSVYWPETFRFAACITAMVLG